MREQSLYFGLKPSSKNVPCVVGSVRQIRVGVTGFPIYPELQHWRSMQANDFNIEVEEIDPAMLTLVEFSPAEHPASIAPPSTPPASPRPARRQHRPRRRVVGALEASDMAPPRVARAC